jgi:hypothetical protein
VKSRVELGKELTLVLGFERNEPNNSESGARSLTIIRLVLWESQVHTTEHWTPPVTDLNDVN